MDIIILKTRGWAIINERHKSFTVIISTITRGRRDSKRAVMVGGAEDDRSRIHEQGYSKKYQRTRLKQDS